MDSSTGRCLPLSQVSGFQGTLDLGPPASSIGPPPLPTSLSSPRHVSRKEPSPPSRPLSMQLSVSGTLLPVTHPSSTRQLLSFGKQCGHLFLQAELGSAPCTPRPTPCISEPQNLDKPSSPPHHKPPPMRLSCMSSGTGAMSVLLVPTFLGLSLCLEHVSVQ